MNSEPRPYLPYGRQTISEADIAAVESVLRSPFLTQGPAIPAFEQAVAAMVNARFGVAVNSATSALHLACLALGLQPGDRLWTSPITFVASANCGRYCGAEVDFVDIDPATGLMSVTALEQKLQVAEREGALPVVFRYISRAAAAIWRRLDHWLNAMDLCCWKASHAIGGRYKGQWRAADIALSQCSAFTR